MNILNQKLTEYGLHEKEAAVYTALLSLGIASVADVAKRAGLKRPTTYLILSDLIAKHLATQMPKGKKVCYKAESPSELTLKLDERRDALTVVLPELQTLFKTNSAAPKIRFYEGKAGLMKLYEEIFRSKEIWSIFSADKFLKMFSREEARHIFRVLDRAGGIIYDLAEDTPFARKFLAEPYRTGLSQKRFLKKAMKISTDILVYGHTVALVSLDTLVGVVIEDKSIAETQKMFIKHLWEESTE